MRPRQLDDVVPGDEGGGDESRHGLLDHHDPVERRGGEGHDAAQRALHQTQPRDPEPSERSRLHHRTPEVGAESEAAHQHAEDVERRPGRVVPRRIFARVRQQSSHQHALDDQRRQPPRRHGKAVPGQQERGDKDLRRRHQDARQPGGVLDAEIDWHGEHAHGPVALDRLEIVEHHDSDGAEAVERGEKDDAAFGQGPLHDGGAGEPRQALVANGDGDGTPPAGLFEPQRRRAVKPRQGQSDDSGAEHPSPKRYGEDQRQPAPQDGDPEAPATRDASGWDGPVRLVDRVDVAVEPVVGRLAGGADRRPRQHHARHREHPVTEERDARRHQAAHEGPDRREPGDGLEQFQHRRRGR